MSVAINEEENDYWVIVPSIADDLDTAQSSDAKARSIPSGKDVNATETQLAISGEIELELEDSMNDEYMFIVIDDYALGCQVALSVRAGNFLHKASVISGGCCLLTGLVGSIWGGRLISPSNTLTLVACLPLGVSSAVCALIYELSWAHDPVCHYQVVPTEDYLTDIPMLEQLQPDSLPRQVILRRRNDKIRRRLHTSMATGAALFCASKLYQWTR
ncbi:hypothetical protein SARC_04646 [Sphaeroforma arctica JP610]|uniref:Transmembrane protein 11, mitochondrial n=1 Tax=Sphaeroforma arctica JP610 TaxID=667725 RepID=A0A0L0G4F5_9EUKA|nr:hypothetical protein SARC_04646 [Sphaeroforma arctica JP610]KNC83088.1 hypothetical protein SARC_04646 [Sphaeroforma arctica JP610]|eukprot:XP_014156990.1 hypothetical protein SARC_04646 [Sphaeroforma arctica JP610]